MRFDHISISLPPGYVQSLDEESRRYGLNRSEFVRILFDGYLTAAATLIRAGTRPGPRDPDTGIETFFPDVLPHRRAEADQWLRDYLKLVVRICQERSELKERAGSVDATDVHGNHAGNNT